MVAYVETFTFEKSEYKKSDDTRDMFGRRVVADYIVEWNPTEEELDAHDRPPSWEYMGELARQSVNAKHMKKRYEYLLERHYEDDGLNNPMFGVSLAIIDCGAS